MQINKPRRRERGREKEFFYFFYCCLNSCYTILILISPSLVQRKGKKKKKIAKQFGSKMGAMVNKWNKVQHCASAFTFRLSHNSRVIFTANIYARFNVIGATGGQSRCQTGALIIHTHATMHAIVSPSNMRRFELNRALLRVAHPSILYCLHIHCYDVYVLCHCIAAHTGRLKLCHMRHMYATPAALSIMQACGDVMLYCSKH